MKQLLSLKVELLRLNKAIANKLQNGLRLKEFFQFFDYAMFQPIVL